MLEERFVGSMLGLALADAMGAGHEGAPPGLRTEFNRDGRGELRWTDDTQMAMGLAASLASCNGLDADQLAGTWARNFAPLRGYGPGAMKLLAMIRDGADWRRANRAVFPDGSYGNGAAMRAAPLGLYFHRDERALLGAAENASAITHAHPLGIDGALVIARATALALDDDLEPSRFLGVLWDFVATDEFRVRLDVAREWLGEEPGPLEVAERLGNSVLAHESVVTAVHLFLRFDGDFMAMIDFVISLGGDTDTIGAMAGGIFGARNGVQALPADLLERLEDRERIESVARRLFEAL